ncbi:radical SAM protein [Halomonas halocynthiae]|uniref:radical SAM protein n=1 Tax=Halomonas halocynthiae TaxID=176290 RepID=UPI0004299ADD|nr:radical SAM protein [Halomonas halocynthiae]
MPVSHTANPYLLSAGARSPQPDKAASSHSQHRLAKSIKTGHQQTRPLSVSLRFPFCHHRCLHCMQTQHHNVSRASITHYLKHFSHQLSQIALQLGEARQIQQLYWSGGNPAALSLDQMSLLVDDITESFSLISDTQLDFSIDLPPRDTSLLMLRHLQALSVNRINFRVIELDPKVQLRIGHPQPSRLLEPLIDEVQRLGLRSLGLDLWIGLPEQTEQGLTNTLHRLIELAPSRLRLFDFCYDPSRFPAQAVLTPHLTNTTRTSHLHEMARKVLNNAGYEAISTKADHPTSPIPKHCLYARQGAELTDAIAQQHRWQTCEQLTIGPNGRVLQ